MMGVLKQHSYYFWTRGNTNYYKNFLKGEILMKDATVTMRIEAKDKELLRAIAIKKDTPISQLIRAAIKEFLAKEVKQ